MYKLNEDGFDEVRHSTDATYVYTDFTSVLIFF